MRQSDHQRYQYPSRRPPSLATVQFQNPDFYRAATFTSTFTDSFTQKGISVAAIPLSNSWGYAVTLSFPASLDRAKVTALGLPDREISTVMRTGQTILPDGRTVTIEDITSCKSPSLSILFLDLINLSDLQNLPNLADFAVIVHFTSIDLLASNEYLDRFPESSMNLCFLNDDSSCAKSIWEMYATDSATRPDLFPPLAWENPEPVSLKHFVPVVSGDYVPLEQVSLVRGDGETRETHNPAFPTCQTFRLTFLGTVAGFASYNRATTSILVQAPGQFILLDCGGGCLSQIRRHYGRANTDAILRQLRCVWISHFHADHIQGLVQLLIERRKLMEEPLLVCCCEKVSSELMRMEEVTGPLRVQFGDRNRPIALGEIVIESFPVSHCEGAMGCVITFQSRLRLAFSGDQAADGTFAAAVGNCNVLIHEATYEAGFELAAPRGHSTISEALEIGRRMQAEFIFLTHFSVRVESRFMALEEGNALCAFDHFSAAYEDLAEAFRVAKDVLQGLLSA
jgi:ribonuclease Z